MLCRRLFFLLVPCLFIAGFALCEKKGKEEKEKAASHINAKQTIRVKYWEIIAAISGKPVRVWAGSQLWIPKDERCGLLTHTATRAKGLSSGQMKCCLPFSN
jgi:hypothetical protein